MTVLQTRRYLPLSGGTLSGIVATPGVKFPATQSASADPNTLDDYEEGTFSPTITFATPGNLSVAYTAQTGIYTKIGREVFINGNIITSTFTFTTASGNLQIWGLPFTMSINSMAIGAIGLSGYTKASYIPVAVTASASSFMGVIATGTGQVLVGITAADMPTGGTVRAYFSAHYEV